MWELLAAVLGKGKDVQVVQHLVPTRTCLQATVLQQARWGDSTATGHKQCSTAQACACPCELQWGSPAPPCSTVSWLGSLQPATLFQESKTMGLMVFVRIKWFWICKVESMRVHDKFIEAANTRTNIERAFGLSKATVNRQHSSDLTGAVMTTTS